MAAHACLKNKVTEDEKCHNLLRWLILYLMPSLVFVIISRLVSNSIVSLHFICLKRRVSRKISLVKNITDECEKFKIQNFKKKKKKKKEVNGKFRECHNHKPQPTPDTKKKRRKTESNVYKTTKQMHEKHIYRSVLPSHSEVITMLTHISLASHCWDIGKPGMESITLESN